MPLPEEGSAVWLGFLAEVRRRYGDADLDDEDIDDDGDDDQGVEPTPLHIGGDPELAALVLYADGSGGIAFDLRAGARPPATVDVFWPDMPSAMRILRPPSAPTAEARQRPAQSSTSSSSEAEGGAPTPPSALVTLAHLTVRRLELSARKTALKAERARLVCEIDASSPCWAKARGAAAADMSHGPWCATCRRGLDVARDIRKAASGLGAVDREIRRHAEASGLWRRS